MPEEQESENGVLVTAAKAIGKAAAKIASIGQSEEEKPQQRAAAAARPGKLPPSNKRRLPRKEKKRQMAVSRKQSGTT